MLTTEKIKEMSHPLTARLVLTGATEGITGNLSIEGIDRFAHLVESHVKQEARDLIWELTYAIEDGLPHGQACAVNCGGTRCDCMKHRLTKKAGAFLSGATKESTDA